ncbi:MAG: type II toxin-antitoxin system VapC family toxin [Planctomycetes bacterium]|nr:type II toxin-antitoxin system VapC family toxin [Planctomycetota bacterium]
MRLALDANRYVDFCRGVDAAVEPVRRAAEIVMPYLVLAELRAGFRCGGRTQQNERVLARFLQSPRVGVLFADEGTTHFYAELFAELRAAGTPIPTNDLWIAALVVQHDLTLLTRDKHFRHVSRMARM